VCVGGEGGAIAAYMTYPGDTFFSIHAFGMVLHLCFHLDDPFHESSSHDQDPGALKVNGVSHPYKTTLKTVDLYILFLEFLERRRKEKKKCSELNVRSQSAVNFFVNVILICCCRPQMFERCHTFKGFISNQ